MKLNSCLTLGALMLFSAAPSFAQAENCSVTNTYANTTTQEEVGSFADCKEVAFKIGDSYCNGLRAGNAGPNPVTLRYTSGGSSEDWVFGCADVPNRPAPGTAVPRPKPTPPTTRPTPPISRPTPPTTRPTPPQTEPTRPLPPGPAPQPVPPPPPPVRVDVIEIDGMEVVPFDVCLTDMPVAYWEFYRDRTRLRIDRDLAFCDSRTYYGNLPLCTHTPRPSNSVVGRFWSGSSASVAMSNQGESKQVPLTSVEMQTNRTWVDTTLGSPNPSCYEPAGSYSVRVRRYSTLRDAETGREINRSFAHSAYVEIRGNRLVREPIWAPRDSNVATGNKKVSNFTIDVQPFETQLNHTFSGTLSHTYGQEPTLRFGGDEFFSHQANAGNASAGGTISVYSQVSPIRSPSVTFTSTDTAKTSAKLAPVVIRDTRLPELLALSPDMETEYVIVAELERDKLFGNEKLGTFVARVINASKKSPLQIDLQAAMDASGANFKLDRKKNDYKVKLSISALRANSKFVTEGASQSTLQQDFAIKKLK